MKFITITIFVLLDIVIAAPPNSSITSLEEKPRRDNIVSDISKRHFDITTLLGEELAEIYNKYVASNEDMNDKTTLVPITEHDSGIFGAEQVHTVTIIDLPIPTETATNASIHVASDSFGKYRPNGPSSPPNLAYEASRAATFAHEATLLATATRAEADEAEITAVTANYARHSAKNKVIIARARAKDAKKALRQALISYGLNTPEYTAAMYYWRTAESGVENAIYTEQVSKMAYFSALSRQYATADSARDAANRARIASDRARITVERANNTTIYAKVDPDQSFVDS